MKINKPKSDYSATIVVINKLVALENCDNVQHAIIMGNSVVVGNDTKEGDIGLFFPVETQLSPKYLSYNNLYKKEELNQDNAKKGYFDINGRIKCVKFRGNKSEGLFMPIKSMVNLGFDAEDFTEGMEFDEVNGVEICKKYVIKVQYSKGTGNGKKAKQPKETKLIDDQFRFHTDTSQLYKNLHHINPEDVIQVSYKMHGTSGISSKVLCKRKLNIFEKVLNWIGIAILILKYDYLYSSRKVIKNPDLNPNANHYYGVDIWGLADAKLREYLNNGMTLYYEVVGYTPGGSAIQGKYDYGCNTGEFEIYIYRITQTSSDGAVFEYSSQQVKEFCALKGLNSVPELFYGKANELYSDNRLTLSNWREGFLNELKTRYNDKDCYMCSTKLPEEGCVVRKDGLEIEAFKCKSAKFYLWETKQLDKGVVDIESEESSEEN